ncbi:response regulator transcription factor [Puia dinghuensis]|uniref:DNA-binding response regulator n=1 Tax=Puia dinghuensis TaxID=1792502 RepID=A0A8J2XSV4_9BACT|nr:response regulator transcription factor [Puia dinghuensis]GGA98117.1 DNA-binding response regulator [Puia dinghuensis]
MRILVIEDDERVAALIKKGLEEMGFAVTIASEGKVGKKLALSGLFQLVITDVMLPDINGIDVCKTIRKGMPDLPIIMLTALGTTDDKVGGFDAGANDYLVKPFDFRELYVRIRELLKRVNAGGSAARKAILKAGNLEMNLQTGIVRRNDKEINLTPKEFRLLEYMMNNQGRVISRAEIAEHVWQTTFDTGTNFIDVYINYLRKKIDKDHDVKLIQTRPGIGFIFSWTESNSPGRP